jgi:hypothetical protein
MLSEKGLDLGDRTVFVVQARNLVDFLTRVTREQYPTPQRLADHQKQFVRGSNS